MLVHQESENYLCIVSDPVFINVGRILAAERLIGSDSYASSVLLFSSHGISARALI